MKLFVVTLKGIGLCTYLNDKFTCYMSDRMRMNGDEKEWV